jgi:hypothetical protein
LALSSAAEYVPRRPHDTVLYSIVREHLATFLAHTERSYAAPLHGYLDERAAEERNNETVEPSAIDGCVQLALARGAFLARPSPSPSDTKDADRERRFSATCDGFDVHCAVRLAADDDLGRERVRLRDGREMLTSRKYDYSLYDVSVQ